MLAPGLALGALIEPHRRDRNGIVRRVAKEERVQLVYERHALQGRRPARALVRLVEDVLALIE